MKLQDFNEKKTLYGIEGTGIDATARKSLTWSNKETKEILGSISPGDKVHIFFSPQRMSDRIFIVKGEFVGLSSTLKANENFTGFTKPPTINTLEKRMFDGVSKSVTGKTVEPDGYGPDGAPSWELALSLI